MYEVYYRMTAMAEAVQALRLEGIDAAGVVAHVGIKEDRKKLIDYTLERFGKLDILVSNAAANPYFGDLMSISDAQWDKLLQINVRTALQFTQEAAPHLEASGRGNVVFVSSIAGYAPIDGISAYSVMKSTLIGLNKALSQSLARRNIRVNAIAPVMSVRAGICLSVYYLYFKLGLFHCLIPGESIPIRLFLGGYDLAPTMRDVSKKFTVKYLLNLVLIDEEDRRYFKQQPFEQNENGFSSDNDKVDGVITDEENGHMMFFRRKEKNEVPVIGKQPHIPSRRDLSNMGDGKDKQEKPTSIGFSNNNIYEMSSDLEASNIYIDSSPVQAFGSPKDFNIQGLTLPALAIVQVNVRKLTLHKGIAGDFGFSIRRVQFPSGQRGELQTVVFAEPTEIRSGPPRPDDIRSGLMPGDQLVEVEGRRVEFMSREELNETVRNAGQTIELVVKAMPELAEFCDRRRGVRDGGDQLMLGHINMRLNEDVPEDQRYWLIHKDGYTIARLMEMMLDGKARIMVAGREMVVDSTDVDRTNPLHMDRIADISGLRYINETSTIHLLRQRYGSNLLYTNAGLQSVMCMTSLKCGQEAHDRLVSLFKGCRRGQMPAHIYATAQQVYRNLQMTGQNQSVLLTGITGSGKTTQLHNFIHYLTVVAGWARALSYEKLMQALSIIEAFGNSATALHRDSTRFVHLFSLGFDKAAAVRSARVQAFLLEADRVIRRNDGEKSFHIFYYMWEGASDELKDRLQLGSIQRTATLSVATQEDKENAVESWSRLVSALNEFGFCGNRFSSMCSVLAAILHLQVAGATPGCAQKAHFLRASHAQIAADLLGVSVDELTQAVFRGKATGNQNTVGNIITRLSLSSRGPDGPEALISFTSALYQELFNVIIDDINKALSANSACSWISILDYPGSTFHSEWADGKQCALGLNELVYNYVNERVSELFHDVSFYEPQELQVYSREQVEVEVELPFLSPHAINRLLDQKQQLVRFNEFVVYIWHIIYFKLLYRACNNIFIAYMYGYRAPFRRTSWFVFTMIFYLMIIFICIELLFF
uniref:PDZ domain-containing protein n=1 Tax=Heterorhabditis bacteriophora TaxID=37862 RepID=A0A1I7XSV6_HETBA